MLALEVLWCMNGLSQSFIKDLFETNMNSCNFRSKNKLVQTEHVSNLRLLALQNKVLLLTLRVCMEYAAR